MDARSCFAVGILAGVIGFGQELRADEPGVSYATDVKPILVRRCAACHGSLKQEGSLRLDAVQLLRAGGDSGPAVIPGKPDESPLMQAVIGTGEMSRMPLEGEPLTAEEIAVLRRWIEQGAPAEDEPIPADPRDHWAYQVPKRPEVPRPAGAGWVYNPVDAFIAVEHERRGLVAVDHAPRHILLRRVYLDLIGLPPSLDELNAFLADESPDAYERTVERLLASPQYGERWGRHWMDVWRYSDWDGYAKEVRESQPHIWRWRDWIVESLNDDEPYDRMIVEMLAGDETAPEDPSTLRATGFLVRNWYKFNRNVWLDNTVEHTAKAFLGTTLNCARCHDHMYDPVSQQAYYEFRAFFEAHDVRTDRVPGQPDVAQDGLVRVYDAKAEEPTFLFARGDEHLPQKDRPLTAALPAALGGTELQIAPVSLGPEAYYPGLRPFVQQEERSRAESGVRQATAALDAARQAVIALSDGPVQSSSTDAAPEPPPSAPDAPARQAVLLAEKTLEAANAELIAVEARIAADRARFSTPPAEDAGDLARAANRAERELAFLRAEQGVLKAEQQLAKARLALKPEDEKTKKGVAEAEANLEKARKSLEDATAAREKPAETYTHFGSVYPQTSTGRRSALARWIASRENPLTARVAVNQIWMRHFGAPLVPTVFDFGLNGQSPTHPELLDWLAVELVDSGWSMKHIHRLVVTSSAYRLHSTRGEHSAANEQLDPDNHFLWRMNPRRMEAEAVRDSTLHIADRLDRRMGGPEHDQTAGQTVPRRSIYFRISKEKRDTFLDLFDSASVVECYRRSESIIPQQALAMSNSPLSLAQARLLAAELAAARASAADEFVRGAFLRVLGRPPSSEEHAECLRFLEEQTNQLAAPASLTPFATGSPASVKPSSDAAQRARESLVHVLLNHHEFVTIR